MSAPRTRDKVRFYAKVPSSKDGRASFSVIRDQRLPSGKRRQEKVEDDRVVALNKQFAAGSLSLDVATDHIKAIVDSLYKEHARPYGTVTWSEDNQKLLDAYWKFRYQDAALKRPEVAEDELNRALNVLGPLSIQNADIKVIQKKLDSAVSGNSQRRLAQRINSLLAFAGRRDKLRRAAKVRKPVKYINEREMGELCQSIGNDAVALLIRVCFYTGCRPGEAFALDETKFRSANELIISEQAHWKTGERVDPKTETSKRHTYLLAEGRPYLEQWIALDDDARALLQKMRYSGDLAALIKAHCRKLWPKHSIKHLTTKDFRHCYAKHLIARGLNIGAVALLLGNSEKVCREYYVGGGASEEVMLAVHQIMSRKPA